MSEQILRDRNNQVRGYIRTQSDGVQVLSDAHNHILGYYRPQSNRTFDRNNQMLGSGNLLTELLRS